MDEEESNLVKYQLLKDDNLKDKIIYLSILARKKEVGTKINKYDIDDFGLDELEQLTKDQIKKNSKNSALLAKLRDIYKILANKIINYKFINSANKIYSDYFNETKEIKFNEMKTIIKKFLNLINCANINHHEKIISKTFKKIKKSNKKNLNSILEVKYLLKLNEAIINEEYNNKQNDYKNRIKENEYKNMFENVIDNLISDNKDQIINNLFIQYAIYYCALEVLNNFNEIIKENEDRDIKELFDLFLKKNK